MSTPATILIFPHRLPLRGDRRAQFANGTDPQGDDTGHEPADEHSADDSAPEPSIDDVFATLTKREWAVLLLLAEGLSDRQIAVRMNVGRETVRSHVAGLLRKLNASSRLEALVIAVRHGKVRIR